MDLFKIGSNIASMQALNSLYKLNSKLSVHQERLSTGKRVNSAQDDTAAFSVAKNVETTKQGHERALQRVKNAQSILSIIEAGQQKQLKLLQSMKNKIIQAQDTTLNTAQRQSILDAVDQVRSEIEDVADQTIFNGHYITARWSYNHNDITYPNSNTIFRVGSGTSSSDTFAVTATILSAPSAEMPIASSAQHHHLQI